MVSRATVTMNTTGTTYIMDWYSNDYYCIETSIADTSTADTFVYSKGCYSNDISRTSGGNIVFTARP